MADTTDNVTLRIDEAIAEVLDAIGDDEEYTAARIELHAAARALAEGTTEEAHARLEKAQRLLDEACPI